MFSLALLIVALIILIISVSAYPTIQERDYKRLMDDEEVERKAVDEILQAYLDGVEYGLSISKGSENTPAEITNNDKKEKDGE